MKILFKILYSAKNLWPYYSIVLALSVLLAIASQVHPFVIKAIVDLSIELIKGYQVDFFIGFLLAAAWFGADILSSLFSICIRYCNDILYVKLKKFFSEQYYKKILNMPYSYYKERSNKDIFKDFKKDTADFSDNLMYLFRNLNKALIIVLSISIIAYYSLAMAIIMLLACLISIWLSLRSDSVYKENQMYKEECEGDVNSHIKEVILQIATVKSFLQEKRELLHLKHESQQCVDASCIQSRQWCSMDILRSSIVSVFFFVALSFLFWQTLRNNFTLGETILLAQFINSLRLSLKNPENVIGAIKNIIKSSKSYFEVIDLDVQKTDKSKTKTLKIQKGKIAFKNVSSKDLIKETSFKIKAGTKIAIIAKDTQYSATITDILIRFSELNSGSVTIDDVDISKVKTSKLRENICFIPQDLCLFASSIRENIAYSRPDATDKAIFSATESALIHEHIQKLPNGYNSKDFNFSDNQKYRILIARAILKNSPILIIHEPKIRLDADTKKALSVLMKGRTVIIIASKLKTVSTSDNVLIIEKGKISEYGSPRKLAESGGTYSKLLSLQSRATDIAKDKLMSFNLVNE